MHTFSSTSVAAAAYNASARLLQIQFCSGTVYQYSEVPPETYRQLLQAPSKGTYFNQAIRGRFQYARVVARQHEARGRKITLPPKAD